MNNMKCNRYLWRLHPSSQAIVRSCAPPKKSASINHHGCKDNGTIRKDVSSTKFSFRLNDDVYIRPKSSKELGVSGRIIDIYDTTKTNEIKPGAAPSNSKKRKLVEDVRVTVQQHCLVHNRVASTHSNPCRTIKKGVRPSRLFPVYDIRNDGESSVQTLILMTPDTLNYRQLATSHLRSSDKVLEIGCSTGECTALVVRRLLLLRSQQCSQKQKEEESTNSVLGGKIVAFDTGPGMIEQAKNRLLPEFNNSMPKGNDDLSSRDHCYSQMVQFHKVDAIADPKGAHSHAVKGDDRKPDVVLIDIGGNRELKGVVRMIQWVQTAFESDSPRLIIVKSEELVEELSRSTQPKGKEGELEENQSILGNESISTKTMQPSVMENGMVDHAQDWFSTLILSYADAIKDVQCNAAKKASTQSAPKYPHAMKAPLVMSPKDNVTPICRFHNYHPDGCKRHNGSSEKCPYDHEYCHWCQDAGHIASNCHSSR